MAGVTDRPFRSLCKRLGAGMAVSEMVASNSLLWGSEKTIRRGNHDGEVEPKVIQIAGADPEMMAEAARYNVDKGAHIIDINMEAYRGSRLEGCFDVEVFSCEVGWVKPEPEIYRLCLQRLGLSASDCIFVGDGGSNELDGAKAVGLRTVFVSGVIEELWPERIASRRAIADHHVQWAHEVEDLCSLATSA